jgi:hypothetical protein
VLLLGDAIVIAGGEQERHAERSQLVGNWPDLSPPSSAATSISRSALPTVAAGPTTSAPASSSSDSNIIAKIA